MRQQLCLGPTWVLRLSHQEAWFQMLCSQLCTTEELASPCPQFLSFPFVTLHDNRKVYQRPWHWDPMTIKLYMLIHTVILNVSARLIVICILSDLLMGKIKKLGLNILNNYEFSNKRTHLRLTPNYSMFFFSFLKCFNFALTCILIYSDFIRFNNNKKKILLLSSELLLTSENLLEIYI